MGYLRPNQVQDMVDEKSVLDRTLASRNITDRGALENQIKRLDGQIEKQSPPDLSPEQRDLPFSFRGQECCSRCGLPASWP